MSDSEVSVIQKAVDSLTKFDSSELENWIKLLLESGITHPLPISTKGTFPASIIRILHSRGNDDLKRKIENAVAKLIDYWNPSIAPADYSVELLTVIAELQIDHAYVKLLGLAKTEELKGKLFGDKDIHLELLRTLFGLKHTSDLGMIAKRDIQDPLYSELSFQKIWEDTERGFLDAVENLNTLFSENTLTSPIDIEYALEGFFLVLGPDNFSSLLQKMLDSVKQMYHEKFLQTCVSIGIDFKLLCKWGEFISEVVENKRRAIIQMTWTIFGVKKPVIKYTSIELTPEINEFFAKRAPQRNLDYTRTNNDKMELLGLINTCFKAYNTPLLYAQPKI